MPTPDSTVCWKPDGGATPHRAGKFGGSGEREPVPGHRQSAGEGQSGHEQRQRAACEQRRQHHHHADRDPDAPNRNDPRPDEIRPSSGSDAECDGEHLRCRDHERGSALGELVLVVEEENAESDHRDLRIEVEAAADRQPPELAVGERARDRGCLDAVHSLAPPQDDRAYERTDAAERSEEEERGLRAAAGRKRGKRESRNEPAEGDRRLPDPEREAALVGREPVHDRASAGRVDARAGGSGNARETRGAR